MDEPWRTQRRLIQKGFDRKQLDALSAIMQDSVADSLRDFDSKIQSGPVDIYPHLMKITFAMVARSVVWRAAEGRRHRPGQRIPSAPCRSSSCGRRCSPISIPGSRSRASCGGMKRCAPAPDAVLMQYIKTRRQQPPGKDLLQTLMDARYTDGEGMSDELVLSESMQLLVAGHETSSNALSWLLYLLSSRPDCLERVRQEFDSVLGERSLSHGDVPKCEFTTQVIQEALRLYPPFWMIDREAIADDQVGDIVDTERLDGHRPSSMVRTMRLGNGMMPRAFDPERFTKANAKLLTPFTYLPFGGGPRVCIGNQYAMLQILMILSDLLRRYDFELTPGAEDRGPADGHPAAEAWYPYGVHQNCGVPHLRGRARLDVRNPNRSKPRRTHVGGAGRDARECWSFASLSIPTPFPCFDRGFQC